MSTDETDLPADVMAFVAEVEARAAKATPGPWKAVVAFDRFDIEQLDGTPVAFNVCDRECDFIIAARADVPTLCRTLREQTARIRTLEDDICIVSCGKCQRAIVGVDQGLAVCPWCERDALHEALREQSRLGIDELRDIGVDVKGAP